MKISFYQKFKYRSIENCAIIESVSHQIHYMLRALFHFQHRHLNSIDDKRYGLRNMHHDRGLYKPLRRSLATTPWPLPFMYPDVPCPLLLFPIALYDREQSITQTFPADWRQQAISAFRTYLKRMHRFK